MKLSRRAAATMLTTLALPVAVVMSFPYSAVSFRAAEERTSPAPSVALISLSPEEEDLAIRATKGIWRGEVSAAERVRTWLPLVELPEDEEGPIMDMNFTLPAGRRKLIAYRPPPLMPSMAAPAVAPLGVEPQTSSQTTFSRKELLELK